MHDLKPSLDSLVVLFVHLSYCTVLFLTRTNLSGQPKFSRRVCRQDSPGCLAYMLELLPSRVCYCCCQLARMLQSRSEESGRRREVVGVQRAKWTLFAARVVARTCLVGGWCWGWWWWCRQGNLRFQATIYQAKLKGMQPGWGLTNRSSHLGIHKQTNACWSLL